MRDNVTEGKHTSACFFFSLLELRNLRDAQEIARPIDSDHERLMIADKTIAAFHRRGAIAIENVFFNRPPNNPYHALA